MLPDPEYPWNMHLPFFSWSIIPLTNLRLDFIPPSPTYPNQINQGSRMASNSKALFFSFSSCVTTFLFTHQYPHPTVWSLKVRTLCSPMHIITHWCYNWSFCFIWNILATMNYEWITWVIREFSGMIVTFSILIGDWLDYTDVCICQNSANEHLKFKHFIIMQFYAKKKKVKQAGFDNWLDRKKV